MAEEDRRGAYAAPAHSGGNPLADMDPDLFAILAVLQPLFAARILQHT